jgi:hypothetical protein
MSDISPIGNIKEILSDLALASTALDKEPTVVPTDALVKVDKPIIEVEVDPSEINPYPVQLTVPGKKMVDVSPPVPMSKITVNARNKDGTHAKGMRVQVKACTQPGRSDTDGHIHDFIGPEFPDDCWQSSRPSSSLVWQDQIGNPITVITDENGTAIVYYFSPKTVFNGVSYYISGIDKIFVSIADDTSIRDNRNTIVTKVPNLKQMYNSSTSNCPGPDQPYGGTEEEFPDGKYQTYFFEVQTEHGCIFYNTQESNDALSRIAHSFVAKQLECRNNPEHRCTIINDKKEEVFVTISGDPRPIKITATNLPWGGLSDIKGDWSPRSGHKTHNSGKEVDIGFGNLKKTDGSYEVDLIQLLRYIITQEKNFGKFPKAEGEDIALTLAQEEKGGSPHIHIFFKA